MEPLDHQRQFTMDPPSMTSPHASGQASKEDIETSHGVTPSGVASSLPLSPVLSPDHKVVNPHSSLNETTEEETESAPPQVIGESKRAKREKQREKRRLKRAAKRAATELAQDQSNTREAKKMRHRPSAAQRSASTLMRLNHLSHLFPKPSLFSALTLDRATTEAMMRMAEKTWGGKNWKRTFLSAQELDDFVSVKDSELRYLKTTLRRASVLRQSPSKSRDPRSREAFVSSLGPLLRARKTYKDTEIDMHEFFEETFRFYTDIIIPCLEAQLTQLRQRLFSACILKERLDNAKARFAEREEKEHRFLALMQDLTSIVPTCPAWDQLWKEKEQILRAREGSESLWDLQQEWDRALVEYKRSLKWE